MESARSGSLLYSQAAEAAASKEVLVRTWTQTQQHFPDLHLAPSPGLPQQEHAGLQLVAQAADSAGEGLRGAAVVLPGAIVSNRSQSMPTAASNYMQMLGSSFGRNSSMRHGV